MQKNELISYRNSVFGRKLKQKNLSDIISIIKNEDLKNVVDELREIRDDDEKREFKKNNLPAFIPALFENNIRKKENLKETSFLIFDLDKLNGQTEIIKSKLMKDDRVFLLFTSPSGQGLKVLFRFDFSLSDYNLYEKIFFHYRKDFERAYSVSVDRTCKDVSHFCFLTADKNLYFNEKSKPLNTKMVFLTNSQNNSSVKIPDNISDAVKCLIGKIPDYDTWLSLCFSLCSLGEAGRKYFVEISKNNPKYADSEEDINKQFDTCLKNYDKEKMHIGTLFYLAKEIGGYSSNNNFWFFEESGNVKISRRLLLEFLENNGFFTIKIGEQYEIVKTENNVLSLCDAADIQRFILDFLRGLNIPDVLEKILAGVNNYFAENFLRSMKLIEPNFLKDTKEKSVFFFKNGVIDVTKNDIKIINYSDINFHIWKNEIIDRDFQNDTEVGDFEKFISNVFKGEEDRINQFKTVIGYLLHSYKNPSETKAVIFTDETINLGCNGRSGKSLISEAVSELRSMVSEDSRNFNFDSAFSFARYVPGTRIYLFDDCGKNFPFERLFSQITNSFNYQKKFKNPVSIPFSESPKILLTSNYVIRGEDTSFRDRKIEVEFSDFYNDKHKPIDDFKKNFFSEDWTNKDWNRFYSFMLKCVQFYLKKGLIKPKPINLIKKKLIANTSQEFSEFSESIETNVESDRAELFERFKKSYPDYTDNFRMRTFSKWLKDFCNIVGAKFSERKSAGKYYVTFTNNVEKEVKNEDLF